MAAAAAASHGGRAGGSDSSDGQDRLGLALAAGTVLIPDPANPALTQQAFGAVAGGANGDGGAACPGPPLAPQQTDKDKNSQIGNDYALHEALNLLKAMNIFLTVNSSRS